jgi:hypothetical protein
MKCLGCDVTYGTVRLMEITDGHYFGTCLNVDHQVKKSRTKKATADDDKNKNSSSQTAAKHTTHGIPCASSSFVPVSLISRNVVFAAVIRSPRSTRVVHTSCNPTVDRIIIHHSSRYIFNPQIEKWLRVSDAHEFLGYVDIVTGNRTVQSSFDLCVRAHVQRPYFVRKIILSNKIRTLYLYYNKRRRLCLRQQ